jgi:hypothetical protein
LTISPSFLAVNGQADSRFRVIFEHPVHRIFEQAVRNAAQPSSFDRLLQAQHIEPRVAVPLTVVGSVAAQARKQCRECEHPYFLVREDAVGSVVLA